MPFAIPMILRESTDHSSNCYFCMVLPVAKGLSRKKKWTKHYPNIPSALRPVPHGEDLPAPDPPESFSLDPDDDQDDDQEISHPEPEASTSA